MPVGQIKYDYQLITNQRKAFDKVHMGKSIREDAKIFLIEFKNDGKQKC